MPTYDYVCQDCNRSFAIQVSIAEYAQGLRPTCPHCGSTRSVRTFAPIQVVSSRKGMRLRRGGCGPSAGPGCCG